MVALISSFIRSERDFNIFIAQKILLHKPKKNVAEGFCQNLISEKAEAERFRKIPPPLKTERISTL